MCKYALLGSLRIPVTEEKLSLFRSEAEIAAAGNDEERGVRQYIQTEYIRWILRNNAA